MRKERSEKHKKEKRRTGRKRTEKMGSAGKNEKQDDDNIKLLIFCCIKHGCFTKIYFQFLLSEKKINPRN